MTDLEQGYRMNPGMSFRINNIHNHSLFPPLCFSLCFQRDPFGTASSLDPDERAQVENQTVPTLKEFLDLAAQHRSLVIFDLRRPPSGHPYRNTWITRTLEVIHNESSINSSQVVKAFCYMAWKCALLTLCLSLKWRDMERYYNSESVIERVRVGVIERLDIRQSPVDRARKGHINGEKEKKKALVHL